MSNIVYGYVGKCLVVDLDTMTACSEELDADLARDFLGGTGYAAKYLYDRQPAGVDPLGPEASILFSTGPLTMNAVPGGGSVELCFKSPLTGAWGESRSGGDFGPDLRRAGFDHIAVRGRAARPVYLVVKDGRAELRPADRLVGKLVSERRAILRDELGDAPYSIACIGPAGERLVAFAAVLFGDRAAGRCGAGAVLGAKNLLAVAVSGRGEPPVADPEALKRTLRAYHAELSKNPTAIGFHDNGTVGDLGANDEKGDWPTKNWRSNSWGKGPELLDRFVERNFVKPYPCYRGCTISCGRKVHVPGDGAYATPEHGGAEYESISCFTAYVQNEDMDAAVHCGYLCNEYGVDTISTGGAIAFALDCAEAGLIDAAQPDGLKLAWGEPATLPALVKLIALRRGVGELLAGGVRSAARKLGRGAEALAVQVKGLEGPAHDPRSGKSLGLSYGTANRGMCHIHPAEAMAWDSGKIDWGLGAYGLTDPATVDRWAEAGKGKDVKLMQDGLNLPDALGTCKFFMYAGVGVDKLAAMLSCITGRQTSGRDLLLASERILNLQRLFNLREGVGAADDLLHPRAGAAPEFGPYAGEARCAVADFPAMLKEYYEARGWDVATGAPTAATLERLGLA